MLKSGITNQEFICSLEGKSNQVRRVVLDIQMICLCRVNKCTGTKIEIFLKM